MTSTTESNPMLALVEDREPQKEPRLAVRRMLAARKGDLQRRRLLTRARHAGEAHRRSDSHEGTPLS